MNSLIELKQNFFSSYGKVVLDNTEHILIKRGFDVDNYDGTDLCVNIKPFTIYISTLFHEGCIDYESYLEFKNPANLHIEKIKKEICGRFKDEIMAIDADQAKDGVSIRIAHALIFKKDDLSKPHNEISMLISLFKRVVQTCESHGLIFKAE